MLSITVNISWDEDDGVLDEEVSLRDAIVSADPGDTIYFDSDLNGATITLNRDEFGDPLSPLLGEIAFDKDLTIAGTDENGNVLDITIEQYDPSSTPGDGIRIFNILDPAGPNNTPVVELIGLTLTGGDVSGDGGAIKSEGPLIIRDSIITGNSATSGGGVRVRLSAASGFSGTVLELDNTTISDNDASRGGGLSVQTLPGHYETIDISGNHATNGSGGGIDVKFNFAGVGGGQGSTTAAINIADSTISNSLLAYSTESDCNTEFLGGRMNCAPIGLLRAPTILGGTNALHRLAA